MDELSRQLGITFDPKRQPRPDLCAYSTIQRGMCHEVLIDGHPAFIEHTIDATELPYIVGERNADPSAATTLRCRASTWRAAVVDFRIQLANHRIKGTTCWSRLCEPVQEPTSLSCADSAPDTVSPLTITKEPTMSTEISKPSASAVPSGTIYLTH